ncbi:MAG: zinc-dependent metalloprotease [Roseiflexaceae bacterium]|nr:zinc-dependent metalloprotease [Roseiflexaceae bacterium]
MAAGFGVRYVLSRQVARPQDQESALVDWEQARQLALRVSRWEQAPIDDRALRHAQYARMVAQSEPLIAAYMGVELPAPVERLFVVDRRDWLLVNFVSFQHLLQPIEELYGKIASSNAATTVMGTVNRKLLGGQMGLLLGYLAQRVLGQYDLSLLSPDPELRGALYFVEPNIKRVQSQLGLSDEDFRLWIALHETTHVFQFEAFPWVRPYFNELLSSFLGEVTDQFNGAGMSFSQIANRLMGGKANGGEHWMQAVLSPQQRQVFDRMQALMSVVEGYSNHVMNEIGEQLLPSFREIERRIAQRKGSRTLIEELFNRVTGMDLKLAQYQQGEAFINAVVAQRGIAFANQVWSGPEYLPTMDEIKNPERWIARVGA